MGKQREIDLLREEVQRLKARLNLREKTAGRCFRFFYTLIT